jgi:hypothetical protein
MVRYRVYSTDGKIKRTEIINTKTNVLFRNIKTKDGIKWKYQNFWRPENVKVIKVIRLKKVI